MAMNNIGKLLILGLLAETVAVWLRFDILPRKTYHVTQISRYQFLERVNLSSVECVNVSIETMYVGSYFGIQKVREAIEKITRNGSLIHI